MIRPELEHKALQQIWEHSLVGIAIVAEDGTFISVNPAYCKILEYTEYELQQRKFQDITHPDDLKADEIMADRVAHSEDDSYLMKKRYITKTGRVIWVILKVNSIETEDGEFAFFLSQASEIVELIPPGAQTHEQISNRLVWLWLKSYSGWIFAILSGSAILIAKVIEYLSKQ